jgi:urea transport system ATP-binding protein
VFEALTVFENLELAMATDKRIFPTLTAIMKPEYRDRIDEVLEMIKLKTLRDKPAGILSHGQKQWLEIGMLLMQKPRLLLVDEPVAGMTEQEMERTAELLTSLAGKQSVVVVEHDMGFVRSIARKVTVLHQGSVLAEGTMDQVSNDREVIKVYLGEEA